MVVAAILVLSGAIVSAGWYGSDARRHDWRAAATQLPRDAVVVVHPEPERVALRHYQTLLAELPRGGARVRDVVVLGYVFGGTVDERYAPPAGFDVVARRRLGGFPRLQLTRFRSDAPLRVSRASVRVVVGPEPALLVVPP